MLSDRAEAGVESDRAGDVVFVRVASRLAAQPRRLAVVGAIPKDVEDPPLVGGQPFGVGGWFRFILEANPGRLALDAGFQIADDRDAVASEGDPPVGEETRA